MFWTSSSENEKPLFLRYKTPIKIFLLITDEMETLRDTFWGAGNALGLSRTNELSGSNDFPKKREENYEKTLVCHFHIVLP